MKMSNHVQCVGRFLIAEFLEPIFTGDYVSRIRIDKKWVIKAKESGRYLVIRVPKGEKIIRPETLRKKKVFKEVFKFADNPMKMYEIDVPHSDKRPKEFYEVS